jgi:hypothetical protein
MDSIRGSMAHGIYLIPKLSPEWYWLSGGLLFIFDPRKTVY